ncbi:MAG: hypothetical protein A4C66_10160 [Nitrospira sp. HN-bin3]|uniref:ATP-grasp fold amidoligase family protein n=1 Tax=Nitrospira cf. moscoviensis SBR1015 TaxID=96242 RepID=UPI000A0B917E|nr:ATP-grasp fold amidoligase family protein [Nitrospira cf. moscoviensis SBR1015]OQW41173.1 MAG: hypothetical protein A4C66_10160 [Nitrospira sp. HN-bin3]
MKSTVPTPKVEALRATLRDTWVHDVVQHVRRIKRRIMRQSEGEAFLLRRYARIHGSPLNLTHPQTFTEKLFWRMVTWNRGDMPARFAQLADKYAVREYVESRVGNEYLVELLWHGDDPRHIPFDLLPAEYVIKPSHAGGQVIIVRGEADREDIVRTLDGWLASDYYWQAREYQYYGIQPRIVIEEYLKTENASGLLDYRFWCFGGVPEVIQVDNHAHDINPFFDIHWNHLDLYYRPKATRPCIPKPRNLERMIQLASQLSNGIDFVRVDFYNIEGKIYCGELTFTPVGGIFTFSPAHWDMKLGEKWALPLDH